MKTYYCSGIEKEERFFWMIRATFADGNQTQPEASLF